MSLLTQIIVAERYGLRLDVARSMLLPVYAVVLLLVLGACSTSSGVTKTGPDTFTITVSASPGKGGVPAAKRMAYEEANAQCAKSLGRELQTIEETAASPTWTEGMAIVTVNFRCLPSGSPIAGKP